MNWGSHPNKRVGWLPTSYKKRVASTRMRCLIPMAELQARRYRAELFKKKRIKEYAVVVFCKRYESKAYQHALALKRYGARIIFDLCDNHFYNPNGWAPLQEAPERLKKMMDLADELVASTEALAEVMCAQLPSARRIAIIPDPIETSLEQLPRSPLADVWHTLKLKKMLHVLHDCELRGRTPLVWFGIHGGPNADYGILDLLKIKDLLESLNDRFPLTLTVISNSQQKYDAAIKPWKIPTYYVEWHPKTFQRALRAHAIAVIPISENPFTRCKGHNRLAQALHAGLAVVADGIPSYRLFFKACILDNWKEGLEAYLSNPELREHHVRTGRSIIESELTSSRVADRWQQVLDSLLLSCAKKNRMASPAGVSYF